MTPPQPPPDFPDYIFLLSNHETRALAVEVAEALANFNSMVYIDDFLAPIHEAVITLMDLDWKRDLGNPAITRALVPEMNDTSTMNDLVVSLEKWFIENFSEHELGRRAFKRAEANRAVADYIYVFRDATRKHIEAFRNVPPMKRLFVHLDSNSTVESVIAEIKRYAL